MRNSANSAFCSRRYRDKERSEPAASSSSATTTPRATTPSERKPAINVTVNPKSLSGGQTASAKSAMKTTSKKIDMGAASNFGRDEFGINSPTHRHTHAEEDLFGGAAAASAANKADLLDDIFQTSSSGGGGGAGAVVEASAAVAGDDDFFNPRADEPNDFGDFASAFGGAASATAAPAPAAAAPAPLSLDGVGASRNCDFADFSAFDGSQPASQPASNPTQDSDDLLFAMNASNSNAQTATLPAASNSNQRVGDLLSDLDGLSLNVPVPSGEWPQSLFFCLFHFYVIAFSCRFMDIVGDANVAAIGSCFTLVFMRM